MKARSTSWIDRAGRVWLVQGALLLGSLLAAGVALGQTTTADIVGTVTDVSGAVVPGADIQVRNNGTGEIKSVKSQGTGDFVFTLLDPGSYSITLTQAGFKTASVKEVRVAAGDRSRVNFALEIGAANETVEVTAATPALQTDNSTLTHAVTAQSVQDLPLNGRNYINLVQITPGANEGPANGLSSGARPDDRRQSSAISINGQSEIMNNQMIDGMDNNERIIGTIGVRPSVDAISELRIQTNSYTAEAGRTGGGVINIISKQGGNTLHGTAYEYFRSDKLNAFPFAFGTIIPKPKLRQHQTGGSISGPIRRDRTFFFGDYERLYSNATSNPIQSIVPTQYEHDHPGDFSDIGKPVYTAAQIDPVGLNYFKLYPGPNGVLANGTPVYTSAPTRQQISNTYDVRVDHNFNGSNLFFARYTYNGVATNFGGRFPTTTVAGVTIAPGGDLGAYFGLANNIAHNAQLNYVHTFTPNLLLELKAGYTLINNSSLPLNYGTAPNAAFGQPNINLDNGVFSGLAPINVAAATALGGGGRFTPLQDLDNTFQYLGDVSYTHGAHSIKTGLGVIRRQGTNVQNSSSLGFWNVADLPSLIQGNFTNVQRSVARFNPHYRTWEPSGFVQDDWHAAKNLTLNLGVRYEVYTPYVEVNNHISNFDPDAGKIILAGVNTSRTAGVRQFYAGVGPRIGFAYTAGSNFVVRGGFGISYFPSDFTSSASLKNSPIVTVFGTCTPVTCGSGIVKLANGVPLPVAPDYTNPIGAIPAAKDLNYRPAYLEQYNLTLEKGLGPNVITASYVGSLGRHLYQDIPDLNAPPPTPSTGTINGSFNPLRPYYARLPNVTTIQQIRSGGSSSYSAVQLAFERRFTKGLSLGTNYTLAHILDNATAPSNQGNEGYGSAPALTRTRDYGNSSLDLRNRFAFTTNFALPFGEKAHGFEAALIKGWQTNVLLVWSSGLPFTVLNASNLSNTNPGSSNTDRPNQTGKANLSNATIARFFDTTQFVAQPSGVLGNAARNSVYGPHYRHLDLSLFKTFTLRERLNLQFRAEGFNITNTANFAQPNASLGTGTFGTITALSNNYSPRAVQFVGRVQF